MNPYATPYTFSTPSFGLPTSSHGQPPQMFASSALQLVQTSQKHQGILPSNPSSPPAIFYGSSCNPLYVSSSGVFNAPVPQQAFGIMHGPSPVTFVNGLSSSPPVMKGLPRRFPSLVQIPMVRPVQPVKTSEHYISSSSYGRVKKEPETSEKSKDIDMFFKMAALKNGITVEMAPKKGSIPDKKNINCLKVGTVGKVAKEQGEKVSRDQNVSDAKNERTEELVKAEAAESRHKIASNKGNDVLPFKDSMSISCKPANETVTHSAEMVNSGQVSDQPSASQGEEMVELSHSNYSSMDSRIHLSNIEERLDQIDIAVKNLIDGIFQKLADEADVDETGGSCEAFYSEDSIEIPAQAESNKNESHLDEVSKPVSLDQDWNAYVFPDAITSDCLERIGTETRSNENRTTGTSEDVVEKMDHPTSNPVNHSEFLVSVKSSLRENATGITSMERQFSSRVCSFSRETSSNEVSQKGDSNYMNNSKTSSESVLSSHLSSQETGSSAAEAMERSEFHKEDTFKDNFERLALKNGIKVGSRHSHSSLKNTCLASTEVPKGLTVARTSPDPANECIHDSETRRRRTSFSEDFLAKKSDIKVGCRRPHSCSEFVDFPRDSDKDTVKHTNRCVQDKNNKSVSEEVFEQLAWKNGIRVGGRSRAASSGHSSVHSVPSRPVLEGSFEALALMNGIRVGSSAQHSTYEEQGNYTDDTQIDTVVDTTPTPTYYLDVSYDYDVNFNVAGAVEESWFHEEQYLWETDQGCNSSSSMHPCLSFEEMAKKNGIKIRSSLKKRLHIATQTPQRNTNTTSCQTTKLTGVKDSGTQVDVQKEAFEKEFNHWMCEELRIINEAASSYREMHIAEVAAREELEQRLAAELDSSVEVQRNNKVVVDELKKALKSKEEDIERITKDLKTTKRYKDNEIKRVTKESKQKDEDLTSVKMESKLKDVVIDNMRTVAREQTEELNVLRDRLQEVEGKLKDMTAATENQSVFLKAQQAQETKNHNGDVEWQVVSNRKLKVWPQSVPIPYPTIEPQGSPKHDMHLLSGFDSNDRVNLDIRKSRSYDDIVKSAQPNVNQVSVSRPRGEQNISKENVRTVELQKSPDDKTSVLRDENGQKEKPNFTENTSPSAYQSLPDTVSPIMQPELNTSPNGLQAVLSSLAPGCLPSGLYPMQFSGVPMFPSTNNNELYKILSTAMGEGYGGGWVNSGTVTGLPAPPPGLTVDPIPLNILPTGSNISVAPPIQPQTHKFSTFDKLMEALRKAFPSYSRPDLMVYLKKAKDSYGSGGFKGKQISEVVDKVAQIINRQA